MRRLIKRLLAALGFVRTGHLLDAVNRAEARLGVLEQVAAQREQDLATLRRALAELECRVALVDRRASLRGRQPRPGAHLDALEGSVNHLAHRLEEIEARHGQPAGSAPRRLTFLTSLCPVGLERQERAVRTWLRYGDAVSFNSQEEIDVIQAAVRDRVGSPLAAVTFSRVAATAKEDLGRPFVLIDSFLDYIPVHRAADRAFVIVNSDILMQLDGLADETGLGEALARLLASGPIFGSRVEVTGDELEPAESELTLADATYFWGFDYFLLTPDQVAPLGRHRFVFGQPWWDYYLPFELLDKHGRLFYLENRVAFHVRHPTRWDEAGFALMERRFRRYRALLAGGNGEGGEAQDFCREIRRRSTRIQLSVRDGIGSPGRP